MDDSTVWDKDAIESLFWLWISCKIDGPEEEQRENRISAPLLCWTQHPLLPLSTHEFILIWKGRSHWKAANVLSSQTACSESSWQFSPFCVLNVWNKLHKELNKHPDLMPWWLWEIMTAFSQNKYIPEEWRKNDSLLCLEVILIWM